ncbi:hypothetical protein AJ80_08139 [Polytolypa hystricis UAMH7299]|uniref:Stress-associated endoplasmic reticulum protein n=1 Tax=Polytolypa hystricis (strain UAMH7299) TaxID=1447883 RepID=A0A2B7XCF8_POLH7|nr:hypothetical protein AJ80_08139 [Polytolypa hystricis UAMH7299]
MASASSTFNPPSPILPEVSIPSFDPLPNMLNTLQAQTPTQRRANERFAKHEAAKRGKPETIVKQKPKSKSPLPIVWVVVLAFIVCGGVIFEFLKVLPEIWGFISSIITRWTS